MKSNQPTIKDVALRAGVSPNVVSRTCNPESGGYVSEASRLRVLQAIEELGYHPNTRARYLRNPRTQTIGFYSGYGTLDIEFEFARAILEGLQSACEELNQDLLIFHNIANQSISTCVDKLTSSKVDGLICHPREDDIELSQALSTSHKPIVRIAEPYPNTPSILAEDWIGGRQLARHLYGRGHRRVIFRRETYEIMSAARRHEGFCHTAQRLGMHVVTTAATSHDDELTNEEQYLLRNFREDGITACVCWRDWSAAKVLVFCKDNGIQVPNDIGVAGFDGMTPDFCPPEHRLTTLVIDWHRIAEIAVERLFDVIEQKDIPDEIFHPCSLYTGNTT